MTIWKITTRLNYVLAAGQSDTESTVCSRGVVKTSGVPNQKVDTPVGASGVQRKRYRGVLTGRGV